LITCHALQLLSLYSCGELGVWNGVLVRRSVRFQHVQYLAFLHLTASYHTHGHLVELLYHSVGGSDAGEVTWLDGNDRTVGEAASLLVEDTAANDTIRLILRDGQVEDGRVDGQRAWRWGSVGGVGSQSNRLIDGRWWRGGRCGSFAGGLLGALLPLLPGRTWLATMNTADCAIWPCPAIELVLNLNMYQIGSCLPSLRDFEVRIVLGMHSCDVTAQEPAELVPLRFLGGSNAEATELFATLDDQGACIGPDVGVRSLLAGHLVVGFW